MLPMDILSVELPKRTDCRRENGDSFQSDHNKFHILLVHRSHSAASSKQERRVELREGYNRLKKV
jgi:hypothetical protein